MENITKRLFELQDQKYREFHSRLMPTVDPAKVIGVRVPTLRRFAREIISTAEAKAFLEELPHEFYEENNLHAFLICDIADFETCAQQVERFLPFVDNWATCDSMNPKVFSKNKEKLIGYIDRWLKSDSVYSVRFGIIMLMKHYLGEDAKAEYLERVADIRSQEYYINMARAWFFATALTKCYDAALPYIEDGRLDLWTHNKAIQKARESLAVPRERKEHLKTLRKNMCE